jgi:hypothetical protein
MGDLQLDGHSNDDRISNLAIAMKDENRLLFHTRTITSALLAVAFIVAFTADAATPKTDVDALWPAVVKAIEEPSKLLSVAVHNVAEMRDGLKREGFDDGERACVGEILNTAIYFHKDLGPVYFVRPLIEQMRLPEDANTVRHMFYIPPQDMSQCADFAVSTLNRDITGIHNAAALAQAIRVRDSMMAIRDIFQEASKEPAHQ